MFGRTLLRCSFCGKDQTQVSKLVAGPKVYICDACVATARQIMDNGDGGHDSKLRASPSLWRRVLSRIFQNASRGDLQRQIHEGAGS
jgi:hypothetical protein